MTGWSLRSLLHRRGAARSTWLSGMHPLTGNFALRGDAIAGSVRQGHGAIADSVLIEVTRGGSVIASCPATRHPQQERFNFVLPIQGRFTGRDLATESIAVTARDSAGNRGRLRLGGAAQLELIRDYLGAPVNVILDLDFTSGGNARPYLGAGWRNAEADFTWTENDDSFISLDAAGEPGTYVLRSTVAAFVRQPVLPFQVLEVFAGTWPIDSQLYREQHMKFSECKFPREAFGDAPRVTLRFHHPNAARPSEVAGSQDTRRLAFRFKRVTLVRLRQAE